MTQRFTAAVPLCNSFTLHYPVSQLSPVLFNLRTGGDSQCVELAHAQQSVCVEPYQLVQSAQAQVTQVVQASERVACGQQTVIRRYT